MVKISGMELYHGFERGLHLGLELLCHFSGHFDRVSAGCILASITQFIEAACTVLGLRSEPRWIDRFFYCGLWSPLGSYLTMANMA